MKVLHLHSTPPDRTVEALAGPWKTEGRNYSFNLYEEPIDYEALLDLIIECDAVITWF